MSGATKLPWDVDPPGYPTDDIRTDDRSEEDMLMAPTRNERQRAVSGAILSAIVLGVMVALVILLMLYVRGQICWTCG